MGLETGTYISDLNTANPAAADGLLDGDNHLRLIKSTIKTTFPNITGAVTPTHTELNYVDGVTSNIQTQLDARAPEGLTTASGLTIPTDKLAGRDTAATGALEDIGVTGGIEFTGTGSIQTSAFTGDVTKAAGGTVTTIASNAVTTAKILDANVTYAKLTDVASAANFRANTASKVLDVAGPWAAAAAVTLTPGVNVSLDLSTGINFNLAIAQNATLDNPSNVKEGQSGRIMITQDGTGSRTLAYGTQYVSAGGVDPVLSTAAGAIDVLYYLALTTTLIQISLTKALS